MTEFINLKDFTLLQQLCFIGATIFWVIVYIWVEVNVRKYRYFGIPALAVTSNLAWEFIWSWIFATQLGTLFVWGARIWFFIDLYLFYRLLQYGYLQLPEHTSILKKYFRWSMFSLIFVWGILIYTFTASFRVYDPIGAITGYMINLVMSALYIMLIIRQPQQPALNTPIALCKMIGTALILVGVALGKNPSIFIIWMGIINLVLDLIYTYLVINRNKIL